MLNRFIWFVKYIKKLEPGFFLSAVAAKVFDALKLLVPLYLSRLVIDAVLAGKSPEAIFLNAAIATSSYFVCAAASGYFLRKANYHHQKFIKKHQVQKSLALLSMNYESTEIDKTQNEIAAIKQMEHTAVSGLHTFQEKISAFCGSLICISIGLILVWELFFANLHNGIKSWGISIAYVAIILLMNWLAGVIDFKTIGTFGNAIKEIHMRNHRYLSSYADMLYNYKIGKDIRLYGDRLGRSYNEKYRMKSAEIYDLFFKLFSVSGGKRDFLGACITAVTAFFVGYKAIEGSIAISSVFLSIGVLELLFKQFEELIDAIAKIVGADVLRKSTRDFFPALKDAAEKLDVNADSREHVTKSDVPIVEFRNVSFKYPNSDRIVLKDINLKIRGKQKLALVGENGSGKTTLIKLLVGLYAPTEGRILINGEDTVSWTAEDFVNFFSVVFQDFKLFSLKLNENVAVSEAPDDRLAAECLEKTGLAEFKEKHGLDSYLYRNFETGGVEISGGEAQKIAMARALYHAGKFFVLDEPTAALDPISEYEIYKNFGEITLENPAIYISHRLSSCIFCDYVAVLENGEIVQTGTHSRLLEVEGGVYSKLWNAQAKHYND